MLSTKLVFDKGIIIETEEFEALNLLYLRNFLGALSKKPNNKNKKTKNMICRLFGGRAWPRVRKYVFFGSWPLADLEKSDLFKIVLELALLAAPF